MIPNQLRVSFMWITQLKCNLFDYFNSISETGPAEEDELYEMYMSEATRVYRLVSDKLVQVPEFSGVVPSYDMLNSKHVSR